MALSDFSNPTPVHTLEGRFLTMSSGARSRWAARAARMRCISKVKRVRDDGSKRMMANVRTGLVGRSMRMTGLAEFRL